MNRMGNGRLAASALVAWLAHAHYARHVLLRLNCALGEAGARCGPDGVVGLGPLDAPAPGPVPGVPGARELGSLGVQVPVTLGRPRHLHFIEVCLEVKGSRGRSRALLRVSTPLHSHSTCPRMPLCLHCLHRSLPALAPRGLPHAGLARGARCRPPLGTQPLGRRLLFKRLLYESEGNVVVAQPGLLGGGGGGRASCGQRQGRPVPVHGGQLQGNILRAAERRLLRGL
mmetsp:Transcript_18383/g.40199  ORF Transcript_18383/g.40199 Transcript_18383/m.40199 type:complete len:228 (-) Transcript_18383:499-1182(-)